MPRYRFTLCNACEVEDLGGMMLPDDDAALAFAHRVLRDVCVFEGEADQHPSWMVKVQAGERVIARVPIKASADQT